jgi:hypothetical protein
MTNVTKEGSHSRMCKYKGKAEAPPVPLRLRAGAFPGGAADEENISPARWSTPDIYRPERSAVRPARARSPSDAAGEEESACASPALPAGKWQPFLFS